VIGKYLWQIEAYQDFVRIELRLRTFSAKWHGSLVSKNSSNGVLDCHHFARKPTSHQLPRYCWIGQNFALPHAVARQPDIHHKSISRSHDSQATHLKLPHTMPQLEEVEDP
jgi:hypothetical protein